MCSDNQVQRMNEALDCLGQTFSLQHLVLDTTQPTANNHRANSSLWRNRFILLVAMALSMKGLISRPLLKTLLK